jgi:TolB protein
MSLMSAIDGSIVFAKDGDIHVITGHEDRNLTGTDAIESSPAWSPDGSRLVFAHDDGQAVDLYSMKPDGSDQTRLTNTPEQESAAGWSPDGKQIGFTTFADPGGGTLWVMNADGTKLHAIYANENAFVGFEDWSPDGRTILLGVDARGGGQLDLYAIGVNGKGLTALTRVEGDDSGGKWSPNGAKFVFWSDGYPPRDGPGIHIMNSDGSSPARVLADTLGLDTAAFAWSPDGQQIAWTGKKEGGGGSSIFVMTSAGTELIQVTEPLTKSTSLDWTRDTD